VRLHLAFHGLPPVGGGSRRSPRRQWRHACLHADYPPGPDERP
jgi:hypothetical protein